MFRKLLLAFLLILSSHFSFASGSYTLSLADFQSKFTTINSNHHFSFGIDTTIIKSWLYDKLTSNSASFYTPAPQMCISGMQQGNLLFRWTGRHKMYYHSYLNLSNGAQGEEQTQEQGVLSSSSGVLYHIFALYGVSGQSRSELIIIIIDRDIFFCDQNSSGPPQGMTSNPSSSVLPTSMLRCMPNPTQQSSKVTFSLPEAQLVSLTLFNPISGKIIARKIEAQFLDKGNHQFQLDLQDLPSGVYIVNLQLEKTNHNFSLIKSD